MFRQKYTNTRIRLFSTFFLICVLFELVACSNDYLQTPVPVETDSGSQDLNQKTTELNIKKTDQSSQPTLPPTPLGIDPGELQGVTLQFWHPWTQEVAIEVESLVEQFNEENPYGILVNINPQGSNLSQNLLEGIRTGMYPDIAVGRNFQIQAWNNNRDIIVDLNTYVFNPEWGLSPEDVADFYSPRWDQEMVNGQRLGLPADTSASFLFYNQSWAQELGYNAPPRTPEEFQDQSCEAAVNSITTALSTDSGSTGIGGWLASTDPAAIMSWIMAFGGTGIDQEDDSYVFDSQDVEEAFTFIKGLFRSGCAWVSESLYPNEEFASRQGLFLSSDVSSLLFQLSAFEMAGSEDEWIPIPYPGESGKPIINIYGSAFTILESSPETQLAAWIFIKWMTQPENQVPFIEASGHYPSRVSTLVLMEDYAQRNPQWEAVKDLIPYSWIEPNYGSWNVARWALSDAVAELINPNFSSDRIPALLKDLDSLLDEIHDQ
jgi:ABC-type glycerol-3-phosphate transport system substrate-binding protein